MPATIHREDSSAWQTVVILILIPLAVLLMNALRVFSGESDDSIYIMLGLAAFAAAAIPTLSIACGNHSLSWQRRVQEALLRLSGFTVIALLLVLGLSVTISGVRHQASDETVRLTWDGRVIHAEATQPMPSFFAVHSVPLETERMLTVYPDQSTTGPQFGQFEPAFYRLRVTLAAEATTESTPLQEANRRLADLGVPVSARSNQLWQQAERAVRSAFAAIEPTKLVDRKTLPVKDPLVQSVLIESIELRPVPKQD